MTLLDFVNEHLFAHGGSDATRSVNKHLFAYVQSKFSDRSSFLRFWSLCLLLFGLDCVSASNFSGIVMVFLQFVVEFFAD